MYLIGAYIIWNFIVFLLYGIDKLKAKAGAWRVSEKTLILCALFLGAVGAFCGMKVFRHKTKHAKFTILVPLLMVLNIVLLIALGIAPEKTVEIIETLGI